MCGRYVIAGYENLTEFSERFQLRQIPLNIFPTYNAAPTQQLPVLLEHEDGDRELRLMRWGLLPRWRRPNQANAPAPINARAETLLDKPMFRPLLPRRRCLVPASGFYEWAKLNGRKQPYHIHLADDALFGFAGLWDESPDGGSSFAIVTTAANALMAPIHDRMPTILAPDAEADWLSPDLVDPHAAQALLRPYPPEAMAADPVSPAVNNPRHNGPELIEPIDDPKT